MDKEPWQITRQNYVNSRVYFANEHGGFIDLPAIFIRAGNFPTDITGNPTHSTGYNGSIKERGISVYSAWRDPKTNKYVLGSGSHELLAGQNEVLDRPFYLVEGKVIGEGSDGEPLLDYQSAKIVKQLNPNEIVYEQDPWLTLTGIELSEEETPRWGGPEQSIIDHEEIVKQALAEGKPVPSEVLKDYPRLLGQPTKNAASISDDLSRWQYLTEKFGKIIPSKSWTKGDYTYEFLIEPKEEGIIGTIIAKDIKGNVVGLLYGGIRGQGLEGAVEVHPHHRRKGIATNLYNFGEEITGKKFLPSRPHTPDAADFWQAREQQTQMQDPKITPIHDMLLKEEQLKRDHYKQATIHNLLFEETEKLNKEAMARQSGGSSLRNSGWNTEWNFSDPTKEIKKVKDQIQKKAKPFFDVALSEFSGDQQGDFRPDPVNFQFHYIKTILPEKNEEANNRTLKTLQVLDKYLPGFSQFEQDLEKYQIPLSPYFFTSSFSNQNGRVAPENLDQFIQSEAGREMKLPDGRRIPNASHYQPHVKRLKSGDKVRMSDYPNVFRIYSMNDIDKVSQADWIIQAIDDKIEAGYTLDDKALLQQMRTLLKNRMTKENITDEASPQFQEYFTYYKNTFNQMRNWWHKREGELPIFCLRLLLKSVKYTKGGIPSVSPNEFRVKKATTPYRPNGWDSSPDDPHKPMLTMPPLRQLPKGEVVYDRGNGNMSYDHLVLNWKGGLDQILQKWGAKAEQWMIALQKGSGLEQMKAESPEAYAAIENIISLRTGNRTGAETLLDLLAKYPDFKKFQRNHLQKSLSSEISTVNELLKMPVSGKNFVDNIPLPQQIAGFVDKIRQIPDPIRASASIKSLSAELCQFYKNGKLSWDNVTLALQAMNAAASPKVKGNGITQLRNAGGAGFDTKKSIDEQGFELLKQYGYQVAKMMDFLYAVVTRCCQEKINTRWDRIPENFFGHNYATSSGNSQGGDILLSVHFDELQGRVQQEEVIVTEKLRYTLAQRTGSNDDPIPLRLNLPWQQMINQFSELYPEAGFQLSQVSEPMSNNLEMLETSIKQALNEARNGIKVTYQDSSGETTVMAAQKKEQELEQIMQPNQPQHPISQNAPYPSNESTELDLPLTEDIPTINPQPGVNTQMQKGNEPAKSAKPMADAQLLFMQKRKNKDRRLLRQQPDKHSRLNSIKEQLLKSANKLDECGEQKAADKLDLLLEKLQQNNYV